MSGTFQYRASAHDHLMTPGSLLLGNPGECFECPHAHGAGDRCVAFRFSLQWFDGTRIVRQCFVEGAIPRTGEVPWLNPVLPEYLVPTGVPQHDLLLEHARQLFEPRGRSAGGDAA
jgi:hypothetical protein